ncbi:MAG: hypothetical protein NTW96_26770 [Planctomycetia bacterium]|nr:hypothetical protein [Planctomycetia bacterium]
MIDAVGGGFAKDAVAGDLKAAGADSESPLSDTALTLLDYLSGSRDPAGGYRNSGDGARDALDTKLDSGAMDVGPAAKRMYSLRAAADSDTTAGVTYDSNGNLTRLDYDDDTSEQWTYDAATGQVASYTDQEGRLTKQRIDPATGRVTAVVRVVGLDDEASEETDDLVTEYAYTDGSGTLPAGLLRSITDPTGAVTRIEYEGDPESPDFGRAVGLTYAYGTVDAATIEFGYDEDGNLATLTDAVGNATTWVLDAEGRVTCESIVINQQTLTREYVYDANGRLWIYTDRNDRAVEYLYNAEGLIEFEKWYDTGDDPRDQPAPTPVRVIQYSYTHDPAGHLTGFSVNDDDVDLAYTYDAAGYLTATSWDFAGLAGTDNVTLAYTYDCGDLVGTQATIGVTADFKNAYAYAYDSFGRLTQVTQTSVTGGNAVADKRVDFTYNSAGQLETIARYADLAALDPVASTVYTYNADLGWLTGLVHTINDTNETITYGYTYEDDGKIDTLDSSEDGLYDYDYDTQDQLIDVTLDTGGGPTAVEHYQYDDNGNRESSTVRGSTKAYTAGQYNRLETIDDGTTVTARR